MPEKIIKAAVILTITAVFFTVCNAAQDDKTVRVLAAISGGKDNTEIPIFQETLSKALGLKIIWEMPGDYDRVLMQKLGTGEAYDLIYMGQPQMYTFVQQGILTDLTGRLNNSPIIRDNYPAGELEKISINGRYYAGLNKQEIFTLPNVNKAITDRAGIDISGLNTMDDYYYMLKAVKLYKENTEGIKPYYPFYIYMPDIWGLQPWFSSLGLRQGVFRDGEGNRYAPYVTPGAAPVWKWLAMLYNENLIDPTSFTGRTADMRNRMWQSQEIVLDVDWVVWTGLYNSNARTAGNYPDKVNVAGLKGTAGPSGRYLLEQGGASLWGIPVNAKNPDGGFKIIEYFATKEGGLLLSAGIPGYDYNLQDERIIFTETGLSHSRDHGAPFPISVQFDFGVLGEMNPGVMESYAIGKESDVVIETMGFNDGDFNTRLYFDIVSRWMTDCMMGRADAGTAIQNAANELRGRGVID